MIENANRINMEWNIRKELFEVLHGWPRIALVFLLGSLLGWIVGNVLPGQYRAEFEMYVAYSADRIYRNPDDYKNWQLSELEIYIYSDDMLNSTLGRLQQVDGYWSQFTIADIRPGLHTYWRNAGKWRLVAEWDEPDRAAQIASAWGAAVIENTKMAIQQGGMAQEMADRIRAFSREEVIVTQRAAHLAQTAQSFAAWKTTALQTPTGQTLTTLERWKLQSLAAGLADLNPSAEILLDQFPLPDASHREVVPWVELAELTVADELAAMQAQGADLAVRRDQLTHEWEAAMSASRNLTVDLMVEQIANIAPEGVVVRNSAQLSLAGGVLSLLVFGLGWLAIASRRARR
jgi:hypothetical protein